MYGVDRVRALRWWLRDADSPVSDKALDINGKGEYEYQSASYLANVIPAFWIEIDY